MKQKWWIAALAATLAFAGLMYFIFSRFTAEDIRSALTASGPLAPYLYVLLFTVLPAFFFPVAVLALDGGLLFGLLAGSLYTFIGAMLNCTLMFMLARNTLRKPIHSYVGRKLSPYWQQKLDESGGRKGFLLLIALRLIPLVPYNLINYAFALTKMKFKTYMIASALGIIPGTVIFINIGDKAIDPSAPSFWISLGLLLLMIVLTILGSKWLFPELPKESDKQDGRKQQEEISP